MIVGSFLRDGMIVESETFIDSNNDDFSAIGICVSSKCRNLGGVRSLVSNPRKNSRKTTKTKTGRRVRGCDLGGVSISGV